MLPADVIVFWGERGGFILVLRGPCLSTGMEEGEVDELLCTNCNCVRFKYRCPHCDSGRTCSLLCSLAHKKSCTRNQHATRFVSLAQFNDTVVDKGKGSWLIDCRSFLFAACWTIGRVSKQVERGNIKRQSIQLAQMRRTEVGYRCFAAQRVQQASSQQNPEIGQ